MKNICLFLFLMVHFGVSGQQKKVEFYFDGLFEKNKQKTDSVQYLHKRITDVIDNKTVLTIEKNEFEKDTVIPIIIYTGKNQYKVNFQKSFISNCSMPQSVTFFYSKRKLYFKLTDCTTTIRTGPVFSNKKSNNRKIK